MSRHQQDRLRGVLPGLAAGDRNGGPIRMALRLAQSLVQRSRFDSDDVLNRYVQWRQEGGFVLLSQQRKHCTRRGDVHRLTTGLSGLSI